MFTNHIEILQTSEELKKLNIIRKRKRKDPWIDLRPFTDEILFMTFDCLFSKRHIARILETRHKLFVSDNRIYNFVCSLNGGKWPNSRNGRGKK